MLVPEGGSNGEVRVVLVVQPHYDSIVIDADKGRLAEVLSDRVRVVGISQAELARQAGISESHVSRILSGKGDLPSPGLLDALARVLRMEPSVLHRAYAESVGLRLEVETIEDGKLSEVIALWPDASEQDRTAFLAALRAFVDEHRRLRGENPPGG